MHFKSIKRDEALPMLEQAKNKTEQKKILCDLLDCKRGELDELITELKLERAEANENKELKKITVRVAKDDALSDTVAYAKYLEEENYRLIKEKMALIRICKNLFELNDELRAYLKERN